MESLCCSLRICHVHLHSPVQSMKWNILLTCAFKSALIWTGLMYSLKLTTSSRRVFCMKASMASAFSSVFLIWSIVRDRSNVYLLLISNWDYLSRWGEESFKSVREWFGDGIQYSLWVDVYLHRYPFGALLTKTSWFGCLNRSRLTEKNTSLSDQIKDRLYRWPSHYWRVSSRFFYLPKSSDRLDNFDQFQKIRSCFNHRKPFIEIFIMLHWYKSHDACKISWNRLKIDLIGQNQYIHDVNRL